MKYKFGFIGCGNMAGAMLKRFLSTGAVCSQEVIICEKTPAKVSWFTELGCAFTPKIAEVAKNCKYLFLGFKPQQFEEVSSELKSNACFEGVVSIMAGINSDSIIESFGKIGLGVARLMPNMACEFGQGVTLQSFKNFSNEDADNLRKIITSLGLAVEIDEEKFNFATAITGCSPAYFFEIFSAFENQCLANGFSKEQARDMIFHSVSGAALLFKKSELEASDLVDKVCSKGGSTIEGVKVMRNGKVEETLVQAIKASTRRNEEIERGQL